MWGEGLIVIVCPAALVDQWRTEIRRYLKPQAVDIIVVLGGVQSRLPTSQYAGQSKHDVNHRVVIISNPVSVYFYRFSRY